MDATIERECEKVIQGGNFKKISEVYKRSLMCGESEEVFTMIMRSVKIGLHGIIKNIQKNIVIDSGLKIEMQKYTMKNLYNTFTFKIKTNEENFLIEIVLTNTYIKSYTAPDGSTVGETAYTSIKLEELMNNDTKDGNIFDIMQNILISDEEAVGELWVNFDVYRLAKNGNYENWMQTNRSVHWRTAIETRKLFSSADMMEIIADILKETARIINAWKFVKFIIGHNPESEVVRPWGVAIVQWYKHGDSIMELDEKSSVVSRLEEFSNAIVKES